MNLFKSNKLFFVARCLLSISVLIYLFTLLNRSNFYNVVLRTNLTYVWIAPLLILMSFYFAALRWHVILYSFKIKLSLGFDVNYTKLTST